MKTEKINYGTTQPDCCKECANKVLKETTKIGEDAYFDKMMEQRAQQEPEPIYLCDVCGEYEAVTVAYGVGVCSEECAERAEVNFLRDMAKFSKDLFERILENGLDEGTEKEMKGIIRCIDDWVK